MENQFCSKCGQANLPNSGACSKCGQPLFSQAANNPNIQGGQPPQSGKGNSKMYWIIGGIAAFLLVGVGIVLLAAVGLIFYASSNDQTARDENQIERSESDSKSDDDDTKSADDSREDDDSDDSGDSEKPMDDVTFPSGKDVDFGDEASNDVDDASLLKFFFEKKSEVGPFKLIKAKTSTDRAYFPNRLAGIQAEYRSGSTNITHRAAIYKTIDDARDDIEVYKQEVKNSGAQIRSSKEDQIIYSRIGLVYLAFYNPQGGLHEISSKNGNDIIKYYNSYFTQ